MIIQIFGSGCAKCSQLEQTAIEAVRELGAEIEVQKVQDMDTMVDMGILVTPALAIDGSVKSAGKNLSKEKIIELIKGEMK